VRRIAVLVLIASVGLGVGLVVRSTGARPVHITSGSMAPTIGVDEWVLVTEADSARSGDIVEFRFPSGSASRAIKRVVAVGGDVVRLTDDALVVNGTAIPLAGEAVRFDRQTITVPEGFYYLLGDNHPASIDSRSFGPIPSSDIVGRVQRTIPDPKLLVLGTAFLAAAVVVLPALWRRRNHGSLCSGDSEKG
jgi:signal peptidase I